MPSVLARCLGAAVGAVGMLGAVSSGWGAPATSAESTPVPAPLIAPLTRRATTPPLLPGPEAPIKPERARLVVALVFDQLGSDTLLRHLGELDPAGAIRRTLARGAYYERSAYPYAVTLTAPGHATIHTGATPRVSGIEGNTIWDTARGAAVAAVHDPRYPVFGREADGVVAGPGRLRVPTVGHALKAQTNGRAKVVSLSQKDRSAILSVGDSADVVLWYDSKLGRFTSSPAWGAALPAWARAHGDTHPISALLTPWQPLSPDAYAERLGPDAAAGEGDPDGLGVTFPHDPSRSPKPWSALGCTPQLAEYLLELAQAAVDREGLGRDTTPDLLAVSVSSTDCVGHAYGPDSWEYVDLLRRVDRAAGAWLARLEAASPLAVLITSDHGVARLPERQSRAAGRLSTAALRARLDAELAGTFGPGPWVASVIAHHVYLTPAARRSPEHGRILEATLALLRRDPAVRGAWTRSAVQAFGTSKDPTERALYESVPDSSEVDIIFLQKPYHVTTSDSLAGRGTGHGTPYAYDREVPVLVGGPGVAHVRRAEPVDQLRVAPTLAALLGIEPPPAAARPSLVGTTPERARPEAVSAPPVRGR